MHLHTFKFIEATDHGQVFPGYLALRKRLFVDKLGWQLKHDGKHELDQYDNLHSVYSIVCYQGRVVGGARGAPCNGEFYGATYMLADASTGKAHLIPRDLMSEVPRTSDTFECTRLVIDSSLDEGKRNLVGRLVVHGLSALCQEHGASKMISLSPPTLKRWLRGLGYMNVRPVGKSYNCVEDGLRYMPFEMDCDTETNAQLVDQHLWQSHFPDQKSELALRLCA